MGIGAIAESFNFFGPNGIASIWWMSSTCPGEDSVTDVTSAADSGLSGLIVCPHLWSVATDDASRTLGRHIKAQIHAKPSRIDHNC